MRRNWGWALGFSPRPRAADERRKDSAMKDPEAYVNAFDGRWTRSTTTGRFLTGFLPKLGRPPKPPTTATLIGGPAKVRQEISEASEKAECEFWRLAARRAASHAKTVEATAKAYVE